MIPQSKIFNNIHKTAAGFATNRVARLSGGNNRVKFNLFTLRDEMTTASVFGELSGFERIMALLVADKNLTREDIEAELHLAIVDCYGFIKKRFNHAEFTNINLDKYLKLRGYFTDSPTPGAATVDLGGSSTKEVSV